MTNVNIFPGNVGIGTNDPVGQLHVGGTDCVLIPKGTTGQRPTSEVDGEIRYNSTLFQYEGWSRNQWTAIGTANPPYLYDFGSSAFTFTNAGQAGRTGPSLDTLKDAYSPSWTDNTSYLNVVTTGFQLWTVPEDATYTIRCGGARGGQSGGAGGASGAYAQGNFYFAEGTKLNLIVGQQGQDGQSSGEAYNYSGGGGGGASWLLSENKSTLYLVGGGGGGSNSRQYNNQSGGSGGGQSQANSTANGPYYSRYGPGGGAGFVNEGSGPTTSRGRKPASGALGGQNGHPQGGRFGGFGGGGGNGALQGGGGGGYGGGGCSDYDETPGGFGGTSRSNGNSISFGSSAFINGNSSDGAIIITKL